MIVVDELGENDLEGFGHCCTWRVKEIVGVVF